MFALLVPLVIWPAIAIALETSQEPFPTAVIIGSGLNGLHLVFWTIADNLLRNNSPTHRPFNKFITRFGPILFAISSYCTSYLLSLYLKELWAPLTVKATYTVVFSVLSNVILILLIGEATPSVIEDLNISDEAKRNIYAGIWALICVLVVIMVYMNLQVSDQKEECLVIKAYWKRTLWKYVLMIGCIASALGIFFFSSMYRLLAIILAYIAVGLNLLGAYWYTGFVHTIISGSFSVCSEHLVSTAMQLIIETVMAIPGIFGIIWLIIHLSLGTLCLIAFITIKLTCPQRLGRVLWNSNQDSNIETNLIELESRSFDPKAHSPSFRENGLCVICLENFFKEERVVYWQTCNHVFHKSCLEKWTAKHSTCPTCKRPAQPQEQALEEN